MLSATSAVSNFFFLPLYRPRPIIGVADIQSYDRSHRRFTRFDFLIIENCLATGNRSYNLHFPDLLSAVMKVLEFQHTVVQGLVSRCR